MNILYNSRTLKYAWLSNFAESPVQLDGVIYPTVEHAYQAAKTEDPLKREQIRQADTAVQAKQMGKFVALRPDFNDIKLQIMEDLLWQKFDTLEYRRLLLSTVSAELIHFCPWGDVFWGVDRAGLGKNHHGRLLMEIRDLMSRADMAKESA